MRREEKRKDLRFEMRMIERYENENEETEETEETEEIFLNFFGDVVKHAARERGFYGCLFCCGFLCLLDLVVCRLQFFWHQ